MSRLSPPDSEGAVARRGAAGIGYRPDLDGLRAIAVILVILTHAKWPWVNNGGDAGVTAFFVLSGFLITGVLMNQRARGRIEALGFYRRRVVRLAPALLGLLAFTLVFGLAIGWAGQWRLGLVACLAYVSNWVQVFGSPIGPLGHTWSLAIEEQFYVLWPAVLLLLPGRLLLPLAALGVMIASLVRLVASGEFEYFSTVTRGDAILLGCALALIRPRWPSVVAFGGVVALVAVALLVPPDNHDLAILAAMAATVAIIGGQLKPLGRLAPIGLRAYSLYLWNWPMTILFGGIGVLAPLMTVLVGEISYRLLEAPVMHRGGARRRPALRTDTASTVVPQSAP